MNQSRESQKKRVITICEVCYRNNQSYLEGSPRHHDVWQLLEAAALYEWKWDG